MDKDRFSTGTFNTDFPLSARIEFLVDRGITQIELSGGNHEKNWQSTLASFPGIDFSFHNYFPPPESEFVFNLASNDPEVRTASINHCKNAIRLTSEYGHKLFSFHAGFCFDPTPESLGKKLESNSLVLRHELASEIFSRSLDVVTTFAEKYQVMPLVENNVLTRSTSSKWGEYSLLLTTSEELELLSQRWGSGLGILLDVGHLRVSSNTHGKDFESELEKGLAIANALHIHSNNGLEDEHLGITGSETWWPKVEAVQQLPWTFEVKPSEVTKTIERARAL